jgi:hypothetical protein
MVFKKMCPTPIVFRIDGLWFYNKRGENIEELPNFTQRPENSSMGQGNLTTDLPYF